MVARWQQQPHNHTPVLSRHKRCSCQDDGSGQHRRYRLNSPIDRPATVDISGHHADNADVYAPALTFLTPLAAVIGATIAVPVLLLFYFLKLRRRPVRVSSTMLWEQAVQDLQVNAPFRMLRLSWLLFLQLLLLALLLLAAGRPAIESGNPPASRYLILIDRSASMQARDGDPGEGNEPVTRLEEARRRAAELIDRVAGDAEVQVLTFAATTRTVQSFTRTRSLLLRSLESIEPTDQPADLEGALRVLEAFVADTGEEERPEPPRIVLISDGNIRSGPAGVTAALGAAEFTWLRVGAPPESPRDNLGIVAFNARRDYEDPALVRVFARITGTQVEAVDVPVTLSLDGVVTARHVLRAVPVETGGLEVARTFDLDGVTTGTLAIRIDREDLLAADNVAALRLRPPAGPRILLVRPDDAPTVVDPVLLAAIETLEGVRVEEAAESRFELMTGTELSLFDLLVFDRVRPERLPRLPTISFGATLPIPGLGVEPYPESDASGRPTTFAYWQRSHPVMRYVGLSPVVVFRPLRIVLPVDENEGSTLCVTPLATGPTDPLIVLLERDGVRRIVIGFEFEATSWWRDPSFPVFLAQAVSYLTLAGDDSAGRAWTTMTPISVSPQPGVSSLSLSGPMEQTWGVSADGAGRVTLGVLPRVGVYEVTGAIPDDRLLCVNMLDEVESRVNSVESLEVAGREATAGTAGSAAPREIWHWFVAAALGLLVLEWCVFALRMRV